MLLVWQEIIATTYRSTICKTHIFSLYSHQCIYIVTHLHTVYLDGLQAVLDSNSRCAWQWRSCELSDTLCSHDWASLEIYLVAMIVQTWRPRSREFGHSLRGWNGASLEMHLEAMIKRVWRYTWRPWLSEIGWVLGGSQGTAHLVLRLDSSVS